MNTAKDNALRRLSQGGSGGKAAAVIRLHGDSYKSAENGAESGAGAEKITVPGAVQAEVHSDADAKQRKARDEALAALLKKLNSDHFVSVEGGKTSVYRETFDHELTRDRLDRMGTQAFKTLHSHEYITINNANGDPVSLRVADIWLNHPLRLTYMNGIALLPGADAPVGVYNLWRGFGCDPKRGAILADVAPAIRHLLDVICSGDEQAFEYLINWLAYAVQHPDRQAEVAIVLIGGRGTGKGTLGRWFRDLFGMHGMHIQHPRHLTGNFNAHLRDCLAMFVDEAFFIGDKAGNSVLKSLITEDQMTLEKKGLDVFSVRNRLKIIMATNEDHAVLAGVDERRYFVLQVSDSKAQAHEYFGKLDYWWRNGGKEALLGYLLDLDLTGFNIRKVPNTVALERQKVQSLAPLDAWMLERLQDGKLRSSDDGWVVEQPRDKIADDFAIHIRMNGHRFVSTSKDSIGAGIRKHMRVGDKRESVGARRRIWIFPTLEDARKQFAESLGLKLLGWGDAADECNGTGYGGEPT